MALPPVISNLPILKMFGIGASQPAKTGKAPADNSGAKLPQDVVELSEAARSRMEGPQDLNESQAGNKAKETGALLSESGVSLGLDPKFSE